jgi:hypothetical protein
MENEKSEFCVSMSTNVRNYGFRNRHAADDDEFFTKDYNRFSSTFLTMSSAKSSVSMESGLQLQLDALTTRLKRRYEIILGK